jgi:flagellum-specific peptidoglycan hydrolase FlgJ
MNAAQSEFLKMVVPAAQYGQRRFGVPASVTIAQAILESGWGKSKLATEYLNFFGIKPGAHAAPDSYVEMPTTEFIDGQPRHVLAPFVRYPNAPLCFGAHARLLSCAPRYASAMAVRNDPAAFAERLQSCGYSTNPRYAAQLHELMRDYDLTQYDLTPLPPAQEERAAA